MCVCAHVFKNGQRSIFENPSERKRDLEGFAKTDRKSDFVIHSENIYWILKIIVSIFII